MSRWVQLSILLWFIFLSNELGHRCYFICFAICYKKSASVRFSSIFSRLDSNFNGEKPTVSRTSRLLQVLFPIISESRSILTLTFVFSPRRNCHISQHLADPIAHLISLSSTLQMIHTQLVVIFALRCLICMHTLGTIPPMSKTQNSTLSTFLFLAPCWKDFEGYLAVNPLEDRDEWVERLWGRLR